MNTNAPILLFVYNRPAHTRRLVESLLRNAEAAGSSLFIYSDAPRDESVRPAVDEVRRYVRSIRGFDRVEVVERTENWGLARSIIDGVSTALQRFDRRRLSVMKKTAVLINTARGPLVDEQALADSLNNEQLYAAGLDVLSSEPPRSDNPLLTARNCFITPHIAWASIEARQRLMRIAVNNLHSWIEGRTVNDVTQK